MTSEIITFTEHKYHTTSVVEVGEDTSYEERYPRLLLLLTSMPLKPFDFFYRGTILAVISGVLYGLNFAPVIYVQDNYKGASQEGNKTVVF